MAPRRTTSTPGQSASRTPVPALAYHGTSPAHRHDIEQNGLKPHPVPQQDQAGAWAEAVFLTPSQDEAGEYAQDIWQADLTGLEHDLVDGPDGYHVITPETITPNRLHLVTQTGLTAPATSRPAIPAVDPEMFDVHHAAKLLSMCVSSLRKETASGRLQCTRVQTTHGTRLVMYSLTHIQEYIRRCNDNGSATGTTGHAGDKKTRP